MDFPDTVARIRRATVQIQAPDHLPDSWRVDELSPSVLGSGFCVLDGTTIVTARHVLPEEQRHIGGQVNVGLPTPDIGGIATSFSRSLFVPWGATCMAISEADDLAILHLHTPVPIKAILAGVEEDARLQPLNLDGGDIRDGESIAASGYPLAHASMVTTAGIVASSWPDVATGRDVRVSRHLADLTSNEGNSGGPCYTRREGTLVGVLIAGRTARVLDAGGRYFSGLSIIVPTERIRAIVAEAGL